MPKKARELGPLDVGRITRPGVHPVGGVAGLLLQVSKTGARSWILRAVVGTRRRDIGLGGFPDVGLAAARSAARELREEIRQGTDPVAKRRAARAALMAEQAKEITFDECARQFLAGKTSEFRNEKHAAQWSSTLSAYASPIIGRLPVAEVELAHIVKILEPIWQAKTETATRVRGRVEAVLSWATVRGYRQGENPARWKGHLDAVLPKPTKLKKIEHHEAMGLDEIGAFMAQLRERKAPAALALEFCTLTACRSGEVRGADWSEINLEAKIWTIPASRTKTDAEHQVPLSSRALEIVASLPHRSGLLFPGPRGGVMSENALVNVLRRMERTETAHGFRSTFRDWCGERTNFPRDLAEMCLAHAIGSKSEAAYRRLRAVEKRRPMMEAWARFCATVQRPAEVVPLTRAEKLSATNAG